MFHSESVVSFSVCFWWWTFSTSQTLSHKKLHGMGEHVIEERGLLFARPSSYSMKFILTNSLSNARFAMKKDAQCSNYYTFLTYALHYITETPVL